MPETSPLLPLVNRPAPEFPSLAPVLTVFSKGPGTLEVTPAIHEAYSSTSSLPSSASSEKCLSSWLVYLCLSILIDIALLLGFPCDQLLVAFAIVAFSNFVAECVFWVIASDDNEYEHAGKLTVPSLLRSKVSSVDYLRMEKDRYGSGMTGRKGRNECPVYTRGGVQLVLLLRDTRISRRCTYLALTIRLAVCICIFGILRVQMPP